MFGEKREDECTTILNGVNKKIFYPAEKKRKVVEKARFVTTGTFRNIDIIEPVVKALDTLKDRFNFELAVVGPIKEELSNLVDRDYIIKTGETTLIEVAEILRAGDIFIYSHLNPPCPNSVIEAVSCGLPVVGFNSGAMTELLFFTKDLLADVSDDVFQRYEDFDYKKLVEKIIMAVENYEFYQEKALENSHLYSFEECGAKYIECFNRFDKKPSFIKKILRL